MPGESLIQELVMTVIANDYENLDTIVAEVSHLAADCGLSVSIDDVTDTLKHLIRSGLAVAYRLSPSPPDHVQVLPGYEDGSNCYFMLTAGGKSVLDQE